jgi:sulfate adenylyltransferase
MLPPPHGGRLTNRVLSGEARAEAREQARSLLRLDIDPERAQEVENIATGVLSPLEGFMGAEAYEAVLTEMRLPDDLAWTIPIVLDVAPGIPVEPGQEIALFSGGVLLALMQVEERFTVDKRRHALSVYGTTDETHPGVVKTQVMSEVLLGGKIALVEETENPFASYSLSPAETRVLFREKGWRTVVGFQTRNVPHLGHEYLQKTALTFSDGLFINPVIGKKKPGDFLDEVILRSYEELIRHYYLRERAVLATLRTEMRYAGPREAIFHAIMRKNFGCTHFIVGRDHAGVGDFYDPFAARDIFQEFPDLGIAPVFFNAFFWCAKCGGVANEKTCPHPAADQIQFSGTRMREMLTAGAVPPPELMRPEVAQAIIAMGDLFVPPAG